MPLIPSKSSLSREGAGCFQKFFNHDRGEVIPHVPRPLQLLHLPTRSPVLTPCLSFVICFLLGCRRRTRTGLVEPDCIEIVHSYSVKVFQFVLLLDAGNHTSTFSRGRPPLDRSTEPMLPPQPLSRSLVYPLRPLYEGGVLSRLFFSFSIRGSRLLHRQRPRTMLQHFAREPFPPAEEALEAFDLFRSGL